MHRIIRSALAATPAFFSFAGIAAPPAAPAVIVSASRFEESAAGKAHGVTVISRDDIAGSTASSLPELLGAQAGIVVRDASGSRDRQIDMRGFGTTGDQNTLILVDGLRINENDLSSAHLSGIPLAAVERIEIMRGSGAVLYGPGASGGTINIITRRAGAESAAAEFSVAAGSHAARQATASLSRGNGTVALAITADHFEADNYRRNNATREDSLTADLRYFADHGTLSLKVIADRQHQRFPGSRSQTQAISDPRGTSTPDDSGATDGSLTQLSLHHYLSWGEVIVEGGYRQRDTTSGFISLGAIGETRSRAWTFTPRLRTEQQLGSGKNELVAGIDLADWDYDARRSGFFGVDNTGSQKNQAIYVQDTLRLATGTTVSVGARRHRVEDVLEQKLLPARSASSRSLGAHEVAVRQDIGGGASAFAKAGRSFRFATVDDNAFTATGDILAPQTSQDAELGVDWKVSAWSLRAAAYRMRLKNEIRFDPITFFNANLDPTRRSGLEIEASWQASADLRLRANLTQPRARFDAGAFAGKDVPLVPEETATLQADWNALANLRTSLIWQYVGKQRFDGDEANTLPLMPAYETVDARADYRIGDWSLNARIRNLFDKKYFSYAFSFAPNAYSTYPQAGRSFWLSASYQLR